MADERKDFVWVDIQLTGDVLRAELRCGSKQGRIYETAKGFYGRVWPRGRGQKGSRIIMAPHPRVDGRSTCFRSMDEAKEAVEQAMLTDLERLARAIDD